MTGKDPQTKQNPRGGRRSNAGRKRHVKDGDETEGMKDIRVDATNMMFVFLGAFSGIREITELRLRMEKTGEYGVISPVIPMRRAHELKREKLAI